MGIGLVKTIEDIGNITIETNNGNPVLVKNIAEVKESLDHCRSGRAQRKR